MSDGKSSYWIQKERAEALEGECEVLAERCARAEAEVERLREAEKNAVSAAKLVTRLTEQRDRANAAEAERDSWKAEHASMCIEAKDAREARRTMASERDALRVEVERLRTALGEVLSAKDLQAAQLWARFALGVTEHHQVEGALDA